MTLHYTLRPDLTARHSAVSVGAEELELKENSDSSNSGGERKWEAA